MVRECGVGRHISRVSFFERDAIQMTGRVYVKPASHICFWMICSSVIMAAPRAQADQINYTLDNVRLVDNTKMLGAFSWTFDVDDFEGGEGVFTTLEIPWRPSGTAPPLEEPGMVLTIESNQIEISLDGNFHDWGLDISLKFVQPLSPTQSSLIDPNTSSFDCCGNGFKKQDFKSGRIIPSTFLVGDFDIDGDTDGADFLKWQRGEVSSPPSASDLTAWEGNYSTAGPLSSVLTALPEPTAVLLGVMGCLMGISFRSQA